MLIKTLAGCTFLFRKNSLPYVKFVTRCVTDRPLGAFAATVTQVSQESHVIEETRKMGTHLIESYDEYQGPSLVIT